jgi:hypothetical protein
MTQTLKISWPAGVQPRAQLDIPGLFFRLHGGWPGVPGARVHHLPPGDRARAGQVCAVLHDRVGLHYGLLHVLEGVAAAAVPHDVPRAPALQHRWGPAVYETCIVIINLIIITMIINIIIKMIIVGFLVVSSVLCWLYHY